MATVAGDRDQLSKASAILDFLSRASSNQTWWGVREISKCVGLPVTTVHRTLGALSQIGYVRRDVSSRYTIGIELMRIARLVRDSDSFVNTARPHLEQLARQSHESALLARFDEATNSLVFVEHIVGIRGCDYDVPLYKHVTLYKGASGASVLSQMANTDGVSGNGDSLNDNQGRGVVLSRGQRIPGAVGIASPVLSPDGTVVGSVTLTLPESRLPSEHRCRQLEQLVWLCAQSIRHDLRILTVGPPKAADQRPRADLERTPTSSRKRSSQLH